MLTIRLFGGLEVVGHEGSRPDLPTRASRDLLAHLALNRGRSYDRDVVAGLLWGERSDRSARKALRNAIWRLRCALKEVGEPDLVRVDGRRLGMLGDAWIDVEEFVAATGGLVPALGRTGTGGDGLTPERASYLERAVGLYRGDVLEDVYAEWAAAPRDRFRIGYLTALERLFAHYRIEQDLHTAVATGRELLRHDPFRERVHRQLMICHWKMGDRPLALRQYQACEKVLRDELDMEPMDETRELMSWIRRGSPPPDPAESSPGAWPRALEALTAGD